MSLLLILMQLLLSSSVTEKLSYTYLSRNRSADIPFCLLFLLHSSLICYMTSFHGCAALSPNAFARSAQPCTRTYLSTSTNPRSVSGNPDDYKSLLGRAPSFQRNTPVSRFVLRNRLPLQPVLDSHCQLQYLEHKWIAVFLLLDVPKPSFKFHDYGRLRSSTTVNCQRRTIFIAKKHYFPANHLFYSLKHCCYELHYHAII